MVLGYLWMQVIPMVGLEDPRTWRSLEMGGTHVMCLMPPVDVSVDPIDEAIEILQAAVNHVEQNLPTRRR